MELFLQNLLAQLGFAPSQKKIDCANAYQARLFPLGVEEKALVAQHLLRAIPNYSVRKTMFLFLTIKDTYCTDLNNGLPSDAAAEHAHRQSQQYHLVSRDQLPYIFSLALLELEASSLDQMPDTDAVTALQKRLFARGYDTPDWAALPERKQQP